MKYTEIVDYIDSLENLTKIEVKIEADEYSGYQVLKTKETFSFGDEDAADEKVNAVRQNLGFESAKKTFKAGKVNKSGEVVRPDSWVVVAVLNH